MVKIMIFSISEEKTISQGCFWARLLGDVFSACAIQAGGNNPTKRAHTCTKEIKDAASRDGNPWAARVPSPPPQCGEVLQHSSGVTQKSFVWSVLWEKLLLAPFQAYQTSHARYSSNTNTSSGSSVAILRRTLISRSLFFLSVQAPVIWTSPLRNCCRIEAMLKRHLQLLLSQDDSWNLPQTSHKPSQPGSIGNGLPPQPWTSPALLAPTELLFPLVLDKV